jgi:hypothetical protein
LPRPRAAGRDACGASLLLAVSKTWPLACVLEAAEAGQRAFGENYVQEGVDKAIATVDRLWSWHFIGPLQSNKTRLVAEHFDWVHSIERLKIAERLSASAPPPAAAAGLRAGQCFRRSEQKRLRPGRSAGPLPSVAPTRAAVARPDGDPGSGRRPRAQRAAFPPTARN